MKKLLTLACGLLLTSFAVEAQQSMNMSKLDSWRHPDFSREYNDVWGYAANGREYAILGSSWGTHFIDVTDPNNIVEVASFAGMDTDVIWRDFATNGHYAYGVADGGNNSLQIFDLSGLPTTVTKVYDSQALTRSSHTVHCDNNKLYFNINSVLGSGGTRAVDIISIADPVNPVYLNTISSPAFFGVHDAYVKNDTAYLSAQYDGFYIYNVANPMNPQLITSVPDLLGGYNHSSWTTADSKTLIFADEVPDGLPLQVYDISDLNNPQLVAGINSNPGATPHNPYIIGDYVVISYYKDGVQVYDISNPSAPVRVGYYDTYPDNVGYTGYPYEGCWSAYPFLPSGNILASDITYGLYVISPPYPVNSASENVLSQQIKVYPNPSAGQVKVTLPAEVAKPEFTLVNTLGQQFKVQAVQSNATSYHINADNLASGMYTLQILGEGKLLSIKLVLN